MGEGIWWANEGIPGSATSVEFNFNDEAEQDPLSFGTTYSWRIEIEDDNGNSALSAPVEFTPVEP